MTEPSGPIIGKQIRDGNPNRSHFYIPTNLLLLDGIADDIAENPLHLLFWLSCCIYSAKKCEGGIIREAIERSEASWMRIGILGSECRNNSSPLWHWEQKHLVLDYYDHHGERAYLNKMEGAIVSRSKKEAKKEARPFQNGPLINHEEQSSRYGTNGFNHVSHQSSINNS